MSRDAELHARFRHPDFEYRTTTGPRKQWDGQNTPPADTDGNPDPTWERNVDAGRDGWERFDYTEESYWRRRKKTAQPCQRPECGGELHTDPWGTPVQCPHRRCPRCDCPDGHTQCDHCKICVHADGGRGASPGEPASEAAIARVRELHRKASHGETCVYCAPLQRVGYDTTWPCDTIRALEGAHISKENEA